MNVYQWRENLRIACKGISVEKSVNAQELGEQLEKWRRPDSTITADELLDYSRDPESLTHDCFDWDDNKAAERFRREQAAHIIRNLNVQKVRVIQKDPDTEPTQVKVRTRAYHSVPREEGQRYRFIEDVLKDPDDALVVLNRCLSQLVNWRRKWNELNEFTEAMEGINDAISKMQDVIASKS